VIAKRIKLAQRRFLPTVATAYIA